MSDQERLKDLVERWDEVWAENHNSDHPYNRGMAEGARSAAEELLREIDRDENAPETCKIDGCEWEAWSHGYCEDCMSDMQHYALDLAGVP